MTDQPQLQTRLSCRKSIKCTKSPQEMTRSQITVNNEALQTEFLAPRSQISGRNFWIGFIGLNEVNRPKLGAIKPQKTYSLLFALPINTNKQTANEDYKSLSNGNRMGKEMMICKRNKRKAPSYFVHKCASMLLLPSTTTFKFVSNYEQ